MSNTIAVVLSFLLSIVLPYQLNAQKVISSIQGSIQYDYYVDTLSAKANLEAYKQKEPEAYKRFGNQLELLNGYTDDLKFTLELREDESYFSIDDRITPDDIMEQMTYQAAIIVTLGAKEGFYVNYDKKERSFFTKIENSKVEVTQPFNNCSWSLTGERKFSQGRVLMEATCMLQLPTRPEGEQTLVRAWYDPSISLPFGPADFHGLPGLIIELYIEGKETKGYVATYININKGNKAPIKLPKTIATLTYEEYAGKVMERSNK
jgi:GLPGLI family protein